MRLTWKKGVAALFSIVMTALVLAVASLFIPEEKAHSVKTLTDGTTVYVIQSLRESVFWPLGAVVLPLALIVSTRVLYRDELEAAKSSSSHNCLGLFLTSIILAPFVIILFLVIVVNPFRLYRTVSINQREVTLSSLYYSWNVPMADVQDVRLICHTKRQVVDMQFQVAAADGRTFKSVSVEALAPAARR